MCVLKVQEDLLVGSFGERLRREREMRNITLEEIAAATRIGTRSLQALEKEEFKKLPGGIFNKGFVRAYAKFLGINEEQAVSDYLAASGEAEKPVDLDATQLLAQHKDFEAKSKAADKRVRELQSIQSDSSSGFPWLALLGLIILLLVYWGGRVGYINYKAHRDEQAQQEAQRKAQADAAAAQAAAAQQVAAQAAAAMAAQPQSNPIVSPDDASAPPSSAPASTIPKPESKQQPKPATTQNLSPVGEAKAPDRSATSALQAGNFVVSISAREKTWVSITADGKHVISLELSPSSRKTVEAHNRVTLIIGNAGGTDVAFNGKPLAPLGGAQQVRTVTINADGSLQ